MQAFRGIVALTPHYFLEKFIGVQHPPAIKHPEYIYEFVGAGFACQILFLVVATDSVRYRGVTAGWSSREIRVRACSLRSVCKTAP